MYVCLLKYMDEGWRSMTAFVARVAALLRVVDIVVVVDPTGLGDGTDAVGL